MPKKDRKINQGSKKKERREERKHEEGRKENQGSGLRLVWIRSWHKNAKACFCIFDWQRHPI